MSTNSSSLYVHPDNCPLLNTTHCGKVALADTKVTPPDQPYISHYQEILDVDFLSEDVVENHKAALEYVDHNQESGLDYISHGQDNNFEYTAQDQHKTLHHNAQENVVWNHKAALQYVDHNQESELDNISHGKNNNFEYTVQAQNKMLHSNVQSTEDDYVVKNQNGEDVCAKLFENNQSISRLATQLYHVINDDESTNSYVSTSSPNNVPTRPAESHICVGGYVDHDLSQVEQPKRAQHQGSVPINKYKGRYVKELAVNWVIPDKSFRYDACIGSERKVGRNYVQLNSGGDVVHTDSQVHLLDLDRQIIDDTVSDTQGAEAVEDGECLQMVLQQKGFMDQFNNAPNMVVEYIIEPGDISSKPCKEDTHTPDQGISDNHYGALGLRMEGVNTQSNTISTSKLYIGKLDDRLHCIYEDLNQLENLESEHLKVSSKPQGTGVRVQSGYVCSPYVELPSYETDPVEYCRTENFNCVNESTESALLDSFNDISEKDTKHLTEEVSHTETNAYICLDSKGIIQ